MAVIVSTGQQIDYCFLSDAMKSLPQLSWLRKGTPIPSGTLTSVYVASQAKVSGEQAETDEIDVRDWLGGTRKAQVKEEVIALGRYGKCLTMLSSTTIGQEAFADEDEDEDALAEKWTPRFRR